jgi:pyrroline-5-carboxylate reductase
MKKIGIIGFGTMGSSIAHGLKSEYDIMVFDKEIHKIKDLDGITGAEHNIHLLESVEVLLLAVKPQDFNHVLSEIKGHVSDKLIISIAAGINTHHIEDYLGKVRVIRAMPNIGVKIAESVTVLCQGKFAENADLDTAQKIFESLGKARIIKEDLMNAATAISSSGLAYVYFELEKRAIRYQNLTPSEKEDFIKRLSDAARAVGFSPQDAQFLAAASVACAFNLLQKTDITPTQLREQITSKGGTTEAAIAVLRQGGSWQEAALAAVRRAEQLFKKE